MIICDLCDFRVAHTYCLGYGNEFPTEDWICDYCDGLISDHDDGLEDDEDDEYGSEISENELEFLHDGAGYRPTRGLLDIISTFYGIDMENQGERIQTRRTRRNNR